MPSVKPSVATACLKYQEMMERWSLIQDLDGGTLRMRAAGKKWLPQEPREKDSQYEIRLERSFLIPAFTDAVDYITDRPFQKAVTISGEVPEPLKSIEKDADRAGRNLTQFARSVFRTAVMYGHTHVLVDFPSLNAPISLAEQRKNDVRPAFIHATPLQVIAWKTERDEVGLERLTEVRIKETRIEEVDEYGEEEVEVVRVYRTADWEVWVNRPQTNSQGAKEDHWVLEDKGVHTFGEVPICTLYTQQQAFMMGDPPLEDLAWMNVAHWQSYSDHRNILRFARVGILFASGFSAEEVEAGLEIGPLKLAHSTNPAAQLKYVEHSGAAIKIGADDLESMEKRMEALGMQPLVERANATTATVGAIGESRTNSRGQAWAMALGDLLTDCYHMAAKWMNIELEEEFKVSVYADFGIMARGGVDIPNLIQARATGEISKELFLNESQRRGFIAENVDIEAEMATQETEGPPGGFGEPEIDPKTGEPVDPPAGPPGKKPFGGKPFFRGR